MKMAKMNGGRPVPDAGLVLSNILCGTATLGGTWSNCAVFAVGTDRISFRPAYRYFLFSPLHHGLCS